MIAVREKYCFFSVLAEYLSEINHFNDLIDEVCGMIGFQKRVRLIVRKTP